MPVDQKYDQRLLKGDHSNETIDATVISQDVVLLLIVIPLVSSIVVIGSVRRSRLDAFPLVHGQEQKASDDEEYQDSADPHTLPVGLGQNSQ